MKMKRRNVFVGALSMLALAAVTVATASVGGVTASAAAVEYGTDSSKWQTLTNISVGTSGLVPTAITDSTLVSTSTFTATTTDVGGNSTAVITSDFTAATTGQYGVMIYYLKWNEGTDSVTWTYGQDYDYQINANDSVFDTDGVTVITGTTGIKASNVAGDWIAVVMSCSYLPFVIECNNGVLSTQTDIWQDGFGGADYTTLFKQKTAVQIAMTDTATGVSIDIGYDAVDLGVDGYTGIAGGGKYISSNTNLRGEGAFSISKVFGDAAFGENNVINVSVDDVASDYTQGDDSGDTSEPLDENDWAGDSSKWQTLTNINVNSSKGLIPKAVSGTDYTFKAVTTDITASTTTADITTTFSEGDGLWGVMIYYLKWNEGTDSVTWSWTTSPQYPLEGVGGSSEMGLTATSASGDWIALAISTMSAPLIIECNNGTMVSYNDDRIWASGFGINDYGYFFNQTTKVSLAIADTETGVTLTAKYDAVGVGIDEIGLIAGTYTSTNANLKGAGAIAVTRAFGNATFSTGASKINTIITLKEAEALATPVVTVNEKTGVATWQAIDGASGYAYKIGENGEEKTIASNFVEMTDGQTLYVKAKGDAINNTDSEWSTPVSFTAKAVDTPVVSLESNVASWNAVIGASGYAYKINGGEEQTTTNTYVELLHGQSITVMAVGNGTTGLDSGWSTAVSFSAPAIATPVVTLASNGVASWSAVTGADGYICKINGVEQDKTTATSVSLKDGDTIQVKAVGDQVTGSDSEYSALQTYTAPQLATPTVIFNGNEASWAEIDGAIGYICKIDGVSQAMLTDNFITLVDGQTIQVQAVGNGETNKSSDFSAIQTYNATQLDAPYIELDGNEAVWEAIDGATGYICEINGVAQDKITATSVSLKHGDTVKVKAVGNGETSKDSDWSNEETYEAEALATPAVTLTELGASWEAVANATGYAYKVNGGAVQTTSELSVNLSGGDTIEVKAIGDGIYYSDSAFSAVKTYEASALATPTVVLNENAASWVNDSNAVKYVYKIGENGDETDAEENSVELTHGQTIYVKAIGNGTNYKDSGWSEAVTYEADALTTPTVTLNGNVAGWNAIAGATKYIYKINDGEEKTVLSTSLVLKHGDSLIVKAVGNGKTNLDSAWSEAVAYEADALTAPVVTLNGNVASWETVDGAVAYAYKINDGEEKTTSATSVSLKHGDTVQVKAVGNGETNVDSVWSDEETYEATALATPAVILNGNVASWAAVDGATGYAYKINGGTEQTTPSTSVVLKHGESIVVKAVGNGETNVDGAFSTAKTYAADALAAPTVTLNGAMAVWTEVDGATGYQYKIGETGEATTATELAVGLTDGQTVYVKALGNGQTALDSDWSEAVTYTAPDDEPSDTPSDEPSDIPSDEPVETPTYTVAEVTAMIDALPESVEGGEVYDKKAWYTRTRAAYLKAKEAYYGLSESDQALVTNSDDLTALKDVLDAFKANVEKAEAVDALIIAIPTTGITSDNYEARKTQIEKAKAAYDALTAEEKEFCQKKGYLDNRIAQLNDYSGEDDGCGSSMGGLAVVGLALAACVVLKRKRKAD